MKPPIFLDSQCVIYFIERNSEFFSKTKALFFQFESQNFPLKTSIFTISESLIHPFRKNDQNLQNLFNNFFLNFANLEITYPDLNTSYLASQIRAKYNFGLIDSYQLALALESNCQTFLTNDSNLKSFPDLNIVLISDL